MKELKKQAEKARQEILKNDTFFEDVLVPMLNDNKARQIQKGKRLKRAVFIAAPALSIAALIIIAVYIFMPTQTSYMGITETKTSDVATANKDLKKTQLISDFDFVMLSYNSETCKHYFFTVSKQIIMEDLIATCEMDLVVDKTYEYKTDEITYTDTLIFLGFTVKFMEENNQSLFESMPVNEFSVKAFMDTGHEKIYFNYIEISLNASSSFTKIIELLINKK